MMETLEGMHSSGLEPYVFWPRENNEQRYPNHFMIFIVTKPKHLLSRSTVQLNQTAHKKQTEKPNITKNAIHLVQTDDRNNLYPQLVT
jgi:hypothetical protein